MEERSDNYDILEFAIHLAFQDLHTRLDDQLYPADGDCDPAKRFDKDYILGKPHEQKE